MTSTHLSDPNSVYGIFSSTPIPDLYFGMAFQLFIPLTIIYGNPSSASGTVSLDVTNGIRLNIRTFDHKHADPNTGRFHNNQVMILPYKIESQLMPVPERIESIIIDGVSIWEGVAKMSVDFPEFGLYIATSLFPINTVVDVTNLDNGRFAHLVVYPLNTSEFLALLSRDAANLLGIENESINRIRLSQNPDTPAFSSFIPY